MNQEPTVQQLFDLSGRTALVTGGSGHLGGSICHALAEAGARVVVTSRDLERAAAVVHTLPVRAGVAHIAIQLDHLRFDEVAPSLDQLRHSCGGIDILVNNAIEHSLADIDHCTALDFNRQISNTTGYFLIAKHICAGAVASGAQASIIMIGSMYGMVGSYPEVYEGIDACSPVAYHAFKGGVLQLTRYLSVYWAKHNVRVNSLSPGPFPKSEASPELQERLELRSPMKRLGLPYEVKGAVVFLASDASSYVTGHNLVIDGGWTAW